MGKSTWEEPEYCRPSIVGPFEDPGVDIRAIKEIVLRLPQKVRDPSTICCDPV